MGRRYPSTPDCGIKGCSRAAYKGLLCRKHYALIPWPMRSAAMMGVMDAQLSAASRHHVKQLRYVRERLREGLA